MGWPGGHLCLLVQVPVPYEPRINRIMKETPEKRVVGCWDLGGDPPKWMDILKWIPGHIFSSWVLKKSNGIWWHEKLDQFWGDSCDDLNNTRGSTLVAHFISRLLRCGSEKVKPKTSSPLNGGFLKWWIFIYHGIMEYLQTNHLLKKHNNNKNISKSCHGWPFLPKNFSGIFHPQNERKLMLERSHFPRSTISGGLFIPENFQPITLRIAK